MMNLADLNGRTFALLLMGKDKSGEDDWIVFGGTAQWDGSALRFVRDGVRFVVPADALSLIQPTSPESKEILLDAEYYVPLSVGPLPDGADESEFIHTGLRWPME